LKQCAIAFLAICITFFFFLNAKNWVGRTALNREKKGDGQIWKKIVKKNLKKIIKKIV